MSDERPPGGRADLHIHTLASDGVSGVAEILDHAERRAGLDVIAITDHERIDAALAAQQLALGRGLHVQVIVGEEVTTRNGHLIGLFLRDRIRPWGSMHDTVARIHDQGGLAIVAHPLVPYPLCAGEGTIRRLLDADARYHPDAIEAFNPTTARIRWSRRVPAFVAELGVAAVGASDAHRAAAVGHAQTRFAGSSAEELRAAIEGRTTTWEGSAYTWRGQLRMFGRQLDKYGRAIRDDVGGAIRRDGFRARPGLPGWTSSAGAIRPTRGGSRRRGRGMKIGLVTPYIYPLPGGVNAHVQYLYENLVARGHDVRIISSTHGPQKSSEGDIIRLGYGWSVPTNGSVGTLTVSHRYGELVQEMLDRERFDVLHFHEPFVPFLSLQLLRFSTSVNVATFHAYSGWSPSYEFGKRMLVRFARRLHGRIAVSAAARHFIDRYFPGDYKVIPNGVDLRRFVGVPPFARWRDGTANILFIGRLEPRKGVMHLLKAYRQLRRDGYDCRLLVVGMGPQEREMRRYIATRRLQEVEMLGRVSDSDKSRAFATADVFVSPATGQESFGIVLLEAMAAGTPIVCSDIHGYKGVVRRGEQALLVPPKDPDAIAAAVATLLRDPVLRARMSASGRDRAVQFGWENVTAKVDDYYGFVIRRLEAQGALPIGFHSPVPPPPARLVSEPGLWPIDLVD